MHRFNKMRVALLAGLLATVVASYFVVVHFQTNSNLNTARAAIDRRDFHLASKHLGAYLDARPEDLEARLLAAQTARRNGDFKEAGRHLQIYTQFHGSQSEFERKLLLLHQGDLSDGADWVTRCSDQPSSLETTLILEAFLDGTLTMLETAHENGVPIDRGETAHHFTRGKQALELWFDLRKAVIDQAQGLVWRGRMHRLTGEPDRALADLRKAVELHPESYAARNHLSSAAFHNAPAEAERHLEWLQRRYPDDRGIRLSLAIAQRQLGKLEEAAVHLDALMALDPDHPPYLLERGSVAVNAGQLDIGERLLRRALAKAPDDPNVYMMLSGCLRNAGRDAEAQNYFDRGKKVADERKRKQAEAAAKLAASAK